MTLNPTQNLPHNTASTYTHTYTRTVIIVLIPFLCPTAWQVDPTVNAARKGQHVKKRTAAGEKNALTADRSGQPFLAV